MRLARLDLLRYGRFTDTSLDFPVTASDLHIVFGTNEAGKSTSLSAIEDLWFGIAHNSPYNFLHDYASMRVGGRLEQGPRSLDVRRRKGNKNTLLGLNDLPLPSGEGLLASFLGGADQAFVTRMFSLNHQRLARGGREIMEARDEVGQTLFAASSGVAGLHEQVAGLIKEADGLWALRRAGHRRCYQALDALEEADRALREHTVTASRWHEAKRAFDARQDLCERLEKDIESRGAEQRRLNRIRRVYRAAQRLSALDEELTDLAHVPLLPGDAGARLEKATHDESNARAKAEEIEGQLTRARIERAALVCDEALLRYADRIQQLHEQRIEVQKEESDLPKRRAELEFAQKHLFSLAEALSWTADDIAAILFRLRSCRAKVATARGLLTTRGERIATIESAKAAWDETEGERCELNRDLAESESGLDVSVLGAIIGATRERGDLGGRVRAAEKEFTDCQTAIDKVLKPLRPPVADAESLIEMPVPPRSVVQRHRDAVHRLDQALGSCDDRIGAAEKEIARRRRACERLARDQGAVPWERLEEARARRDLGWTLLKRHYIAGERVAENELRAFCTDPSDLSEAYTRAVAAADRLADQRFDKAQAVGEMAAILGQIDDLRTELTTLREQKNGLEDKQRALASVWAGLWQEAPFEPCAPEQMLSWLDNRADLLGLIERRDQAASQVATLKDEEAGARASLIDELTELGEHPEALSAQPLRVLLGTAATVHQHHERRADTRRVLEVRRRKLDAERGRKIAAFDKAQMMWRTWREDWVAALQALHLEAINVPETIADQLETIDDMRLLANEIDQLRHERIGMIERDIQGFGEAVAALVGLAAPELVGREPAAATVALEKRLDDARRIRDQQREKEQVMASLERRIAECTATAGAARETLRELREISGAEDLGQLKEAIAKSCRKRDLDAEQVELVRYLETEGDGLPVPDLRAECEGVDLDEAAAREETLRIELADLRRRLTEATEERANARQAFEAIGGGPRAADAAAARQEALASLTDCAEQFVRVRTAATLLQWAVDRYRREKQAPLLTRAGRVFATLTSGSFVGLEVEFDEQDRAQLAGVRPNRTTVGVGGMSDGTADQLYLALRLASVDEYLSRAQPLPFVADDLFINFDDTRAAAGFEVLAELGLKTQVLFFTHHRHLVDIARSTLGAAISVVTLN